MILRQDFLLSQGAQQFGKGVLGHSLERAGRGAEKTERLSRLETAILRDGRQELLHERGVVRSVDSRRLKPVFQQKRDDGRGLHRIQSKPRFQSSLLVQGILDDMAAQDCRFTLSSSGTPQSLAEACNGRRRANLHYAFDRADIDAKLQRARANGSCRALTLLQRSLGFVADFLRQVAVMRPELLGDLSLLTQLIQKMRVALNLPTAVREPAHASSAGGNGTYSGGTDCNTPPICTGDAVLCGASRAQWATTCRVHTDLAGTSPAPSGSTLGTSGAYDQGSLWVTPTAGDMVGDQANAGNYDQSGFGYGAQCPFTDTHITFMGSSFDVPWSEACTVTAYLRWVIIGFSLFAAACITAGSSH